MSTNTKTATAKKEFNLEQAFTLWKKTSKNGKAYFTGTCESRESYLTAFYNTNKNNPKEPDIRIYERDAEGNLSKEELCSMWCNATKNGKKILSGKLDAKKIVGFINEKANEKQPYISAYFEDEKNEGQPKNTPQKGEKPKKSSKKETYEEVEDDNVDLPF